MSRGEKDREALGGRTAEPHGHCHSHGDGHDHPHDHGQHADDAGHGHDHSHAPTVTASNERTVLLALLLTAGFMIAEVIGGLLSGSLALIADAGHMLTDAVALGLAWAGFYFGKRAATSTKTFGYLRLEVLAGFVNAVTLLLLVAWIAWEAVGRLLAPSPVLAGPMLAVAVIGLVVNIFVFLILRRADTEHVNIQGAILHVLGDLLGSVAAIVAAVAIYFTGWTPIDPILSIVITLLILRSAWLITKESGHILLQGAPSTIDVREVSRDLEATIPNVQSIHHVHAWSLSENRHVMTLHALTCDDVPPESVAAAIKQRLKQTFGVVHATVEVEHQSCADAAHAQGGAEH